VAEPRQIETRRGEREPSMEFDGPCGCRLIVVMSQDSVGVSEFEMRCI
jgi:hypothetical protein